MKNIHVINDSMQDTMYVVERPYSRERGGGDGVNRMSRWIAKIETVIYIHNALCIPIFRRNKNCLRKF